MVDDWIRHDIWPDSKLTRHKTERGKYKRRAKGRLVWKLRKSLGKRQEEDRWIGGRKKDGNDKCARDYIQDKRRQKMKVKFVTESKRRRRRDAEFRWRSQHFTCGCGWPSTFLSPSPSGPCFSPLCQDVSSVCRHGVGPFPRFCASVPPLLLLRSCLHSNLPNICLITAICGAPLPRINREPNQDIHFVKILAHRSNWHNSEARCALL